MQATKYTVMIELEVLSMDAAPGLIMEALQVMENENQTGSLMKEDGDFIKWVTKSERVEF